MHSFYTGRRCFRKSGKIQNPGIFLPFPFHDIIPEIDRFLMPESGIFGRRRLSFRPGAEINEGKI